MTRGIREKRAWVGLVSRLLPTGLIQWGPMSEFNLKHIAALSKLHFEEKELKVLESQVSGILKFVDELKHVDVEGVSPTSHPLLLTNVFREDETAVSLDIQEFHKHAPQVRGRFFEVPKIIEGNP